MPRWFISQELKELALASSLWGVSNATIEEFYGIKESVMDAHIFPYFFVFYTDLFGEV